MSFCIRIQAAEPLPLDLLFPLALLLPQFVQKDISFLFRHGLGSFLSVLVQGQFYKAALPQQDLPEGQTYTPGQTAKVCVEMWDMNWTVQPGSCLRLDVSSSHISTQTFAVWPGV